MLVLAAISPAVADVTVEGPPGCLREEQLDLEVRQVLGDEAVDRLHLSARLYGTTTWQLSIEVSDGGKLLWERVLSVEQADCEFLPALVARSVERGLSSVPGWGIDGPPRESERPELGITATFTLPTTYMRFTLGGVVWIPVVGPLHVEGDLEGFGSFEESLSSGDARFAGLWGAVGPGLELDVGRDSIHASVRGAVGPAVLIARVPPATAVDLAPHYAVVGDLGFVWRHGLRVALRSEIALNPILPTFQWVDTNGMPDGRVFVGTPEPRLRIGLALGYTGSIGSTEGSDRQRP